MNWLVVFFFFRELILDDTRGNREARRGTIDMLRPDWLLVPGPESGLVPAAGPGSGASPPTPLTPLEHALPASPSLAQRPP